VPGLHRYEVAQRFQPAVTRLHARTADEVIDQAPGVLGRLPQRRWSSDEVRDWRGPPAVWASWAG
jgi:hypothetical protein